MTDEPLVEWVTCESCESRHTVCSECGGNFITPVDFVEYPSGDRAFSNVRRAILKSVEGAELTVRSTCWDCGATQDRTLTVAVETEVPE